MKKLFFIAALLMAMGTIVPTNNESWYQRAKGHLHRGKEHVKKHWKKYATGAAALGFGTAAYLNRDRLGSYWTERQAKNIKPDLTIPNPQHIKSTQPPQFKDPITEQKEKDLMAYELDMQNGGVASNLDRQYEELEKTYKLGELVVKNYTKPSTKAWEWLKEKLFGIPQTSIKDLIHQLEEEQKPSLWERIKSRWPGNVLQEQSSLQKK